MKDELGNSEDTNGIQVSELLTALKEKLGSLKRF